MEWQQRVKRAKRSADRVRLLTGGLIGSVLVASLVALVVIMNTEPTPPTPGDLDTLLATGTGKDWADLSTKTKLEVCIKYATRTGKHDGLFYLEFAETFYNPGTNQPGLVNHPLADVFKVASSVPPADERH